MNQPNQAVEEIRIKDPAICRAVAEEQQAGGESTATKTVARIVNEYRTMKHFIRPARRNNRQQRRASAQ